MTTPSAPPPQPYNGPPREPDVVINRTADPELMQGRINTDYIIDFDAKQQARALEQGVETASAVQDAAYEDVEDSRRRDEQSDQLESGTVEKNRPKIADVVDPETHERIGSKSNDKSNDKSKRVSRQRRKDRSR